MKTSQCLESTASRMDYIKNGVVSYQGFVNTKARAKRGPGFYEKYWRGLRTDSRIFIVIFGIRYTVRPLHEECMCELSGAQQLI